MMTTRSKTPTLLIAARACCMTVMTVLALTCCGGAEFASMWKQSAIVVDGNGDEWEGAMVYLEDQKCAFGIQNDSTALYVCLKTGDRATQMKFMANGLTLWFDGTGGGEKNIGVKFPVGMAGLRGDRASEGDDMMQSAPQGGMQGSMQGSMQSGQMSEAMRLRTEQMYNTIELSQTSTSNDAVRTTLAMASKAYKIKAAIRDTLGVLTYEMMIPLSGASYAAGASLGKTMSLVLESGEMKMPSGTQGGGGGMGGGGMRGGGGGMGGGGMRGGGGGMRGGSGGMSGNMGSMREQLKLSLQVKIPTKPGS